MEFVNSILELDQQSNGKLLVMVLLMLFSIVVLFMFQHYFRHPQNWVAGAMFVSIIVAVFALLNDTLGFPITPITILYGSIIGGIFLLAFWINIYGAKLTFVFFIAALTCFIHSIDIFLEVDQNVQWILYLLIGVLSLAVAGFIFIKEEYRISQERKFDENGRYYGQKDT